MTSAAIACFSDRRRDRRHVARVSRKVGPRRRRPECRIGRRERRTCVRRGRDRTKTAFGRRSPAQTGRRTAAARGNRKGASGRERGPGPAGTPTGRKGCARPRKQRNGGRTPTQPKPSVAGSRQIPSASARRNCRTQAERRVYALQIAGAQRDWEGNNPEGAWAHLDKCRRELRGWEHDYLFTLFTQNQKTFKGHRAPVSSVTFSSDGKRIASGS